MLLPETVKSLDGDHDLVDEAFAIDARLRDVQARHLARVLVFEALPEDCAHLGRRGDDGPLDLGPRHQGTLLGVIRQLQLPDLFIQELGSLFSRQRPIPNRGKDGPDLGRVIEPVPALDPLRRQGLDDSGDESAIPSGRCRDGGRGLTCGAFRFLCSHRSMAGGAGNQ